MKITGLKLLLLFLGISHILVISQEIIVDTEFGIRPTFIEKDNNNDIIITAMTKDTANFWQTMILKVTADLDTTYRIIDDTLNELFAPRVLVTQNNRYIVNTVERLDGGGNWFDRLTFIVFDEGLNILSFKRYNMEHIYPAVNDVKMSFVQNEDGRIFGFGIRGDNTDFFAMEITEMGDTLRTQRIHSGFASNGPLYSDVMESHNDSIACYAFIAGFDNQGAWKVLTADTAFNYTYKNIELEEGFNDIQSVKANWLNDSIYMGVGFLGIGKDKFIHEDLVLYKANANQGHEVIGPPLWISRPDTTDFTASNIPTFVDLSYIYVGSYRGSSPGASYNGRYMVAIVDEGLNLIGMKSLGKDGFQYEMHCLQATDDLGCIVTGTVHDNLNAPSYDWDMFIRKIMPGDIVEVAENTEDPYDSDYFLYPNPGSDMLNIKTARKDVVMKMFDNGGRIVLQHQLSNGFDNMINVQNLPPGTYILHFTDRDGYSESLSWIKN